MAYLFKADRGALAAAGHERFAHVPFILSADMAYLDGPNRFLRERATGDWHLNRRDGAPNGRAPKPCENTVMAYARDIENAWSFFEHFGLDWRTVSYQRLLDTYDRWMGDGRWSSDGKRLEDSTINRRVDTVVECLSWAADRGLRERFEVATELRTETVRAGRFAHREQRSVEIRIGRRRVHPRKLRLPAASEVQGWLAEVAVRRGRTKALMCRAILETGMRLEETALLRARQLPDPAEFGPGRPARMEILYGTKGSRVAGDPEKKGKPRTLRFTVAFLQELTNYKQLRRAKALSAFRSLNPGRPLPEGLFLSERTGEPVTPAALYKAWHECASLPFPGFSPHIGRHTFACFTVLRLIRDETALIAKTIDSVPKSLILQHATNLIDIYIRPVLGHVSERTTERYLDWVADHLLVAEHRAAWASYLDGADA